MAARPTLRHAAATSKHSWMASGAHFIKLETCAEEADCASGYCLAGATDNESRNCAGPDRPWGAPGSRGFRSRETLAVGSATYICAAPPAPSTAVGWRPARDIGETCAEAADCTSGYCLPGPPDNQARFCANADTYCGARNHAGFTLREVARLEGRYFRCVGRGEWQPYDPIFIKPNAAEVAQ